jgi:predicted enzyme related to lactoylglutathione lyase
MAKASMAGNIYFEIQADDPGGALDFYKEVFGWRFEAAAGLPVAYWRVEANGAPGGVLKRPAKAPPPEPGTNAFVCSFEVDDFDAVARTIQAAGGIVALPKFGFLTSAGKDTSSIRKAIRSGYFSRTRTRAELIVV